MRVCSKCRAEKPEDAFWRQSSRKDGLQAACIQCMTDSHKKWRSGLDDGRTARRKKQNIRWMNDSRARKPILQMLRSSKARAKKAGLEFSLTEGDIRIPDFCPVLGIRLVFGVKRGSGLKERDQRPSIDRIDNTKGYTPDNIIIVSFRANRLKSDASIGELLAVAEFYRGLDEDRDRNIEGCRIVRTPVARQRRSKHLPTVQSPPKEEESSLLEREKGHGRNSVVLPPLRMERGRVL